MIEVVPPQFYLASQSPRRLTILKDLGYHFSVIKLEVDETPLTNEEPISYVKRVALAKALAALSLRQNQTLPVLAADTTVTIHNQILGKPKSTEDARAMLKLLSANKHEVYTAICLAQSRTEFTEQLSSSVIEFTELSDSEISAYCQTSEPMDKAGAYAIQGYAAAFIKYMQGSPSGVKGLPIFETVQLLKKYNIGLFND